MNHFTMIPIAVIAIAVSGYLLRKRGIKAAGTVLLAIGLISLAIMILGNTLGKIERKK